MNYRYRKLQTSQYVQPVRVIYERMYSNGKWYEEKNIDMFILSAIVKDAWLANREKREQMTKLEIIMALSNGTELRYDNDWYAKIRQQPAAIKQMVTDQTMCQCGHLVASELVMRASLGTACPDCYDKMSD